MPKKQLDLPETFKKQMRLLLLDEMAALENALQTAAPVSIRLNTNKLKHCPYNQLERVKWCDNAYYLPERPIFTLDPLFHAGGYYVQEASSMFLEQCIKQITADENTPKIVLDLCAAPGGKSTHLADLLPPDSLLVSNEVISGRANILLENLTKWGCSNSVVTNNDPRDFKKLRHFFDIILVDAPCSGEGMFRKDTNAAKEWSPANVKLCADRQHRILADVWEALKPGGFLIYSTCTYNTDENEDNLVWLMDNFDCSAVTINYPSTWGIAPSFIENLPAARFFPHKVKGEGLFMAVMRKNGDNLQVSPTKHSKFKFQPLSKQRTHLQEWLKQPQSRILVENYNMVYAIPENYEYEISMLYNNLKVVLAGIVMAEFKGKDILPAPAFALNQQININKFTRLNVSMDVALDYLRRKTINANENMPCGYILISYDDIPLGWAKNVGKRCNNLFPQKWRIKNL